MSGRTTAASPRSCALDAELLAANGCLFGGGTAIALRHGEYLESVDIDFLVSDRRLPGPARAAHRAAGVDAIARAPGLLEATREVRADQYGIRTLSPPRVRRIKFEIVSEGRIALEPPGEADRICGVATLTPLDMAATKPLANADRWADDAVMSRDLIDLAMMQPGKALFRLAAAKAATPMARASPPRWPRRSRRCARDRSGSTAAWKRCR